MTGCAAEAAVDLTAGPRRVKRMLNAAAVLTLVVGVTVTLVVLTTSDHRIEVFGHVVVLHNGVQLDVWHDGLRVARWYDRQYTAIPIAFLTVLTYAGLRQAASTVGRPRRAVATGAGPHGFPLD